MAQSICTSWTLQSLRSNDGMKPMPLDGAATRASVAKRWNGWSMGMKAALAVAVVLVIVGISLGVAAAAGLFNSEALKLYTLDVCDNQPKNMVGILAANGSSYYRENAGWQGTLYTKQGENGGCVETYTTPYSSDWPPVTSNSSTKPDITGTGLTDDKVDMWKDTSTGYYHLRINKCIVYHYNGNTEEDYTKKVGVAWPIVKADGTIEISKPVCKMLKLRKLKLCPGQSSDTVDILAANGSSYHLKPGWEGTLYTKKDVSNDDCVKTYTTYHTSWPPVTSNSSAKPAITGTDLTDGMVDMWQNPSTGEYHLRINECIVYYYNGNTEDDYTKQVSEAWPIVKADGDKMKESPCDTVGQTRA